MQLHYSGLLVAVVELDLLLVVVEEEAVDLLEELLMVHIMDMPVLVMDLRAMDQRLSLMLHQILVVEEVEEIHLREVVQVVPVLSSLLTPHK